MTELKDTIDNGESEVQIATIGTVIGTGPNGEPVEQHLTEQSLMALADKHKDEELLVDQDHESETVGKTEAKGWLSGLKFIRHRTQVDREQGVPLAISIVGIEQGHKRAY